MNTLNSRMPEFLAQDRTECDGLTAKRVWNDLLNWEIALRRDTQMPDGLIIQWLEQIGFAFSALQSYARNSGKDDGFNRAANTLKDLKNSGLFGAGR